MHGEVWNLSISGGFMDVAAFGPLPEGSVVVSVHWAFVDRTVGGAVDPLSLYLGAFQGPPRCVTGDAGNATRFEQARAMPLCRDTFLGGQCPVLSDGAYSQAPLLYRVGPLTYVCVGVVGNAADTWLGWVALDVEYPPEKKPGPAPKGKSGGPSRAAAPTFAKPAC